MKSGFKFFLSLIVVAYIFLIFSFAYNGYPGFIQDSTCFLPTAYFINHFHQLINPLYDAGLDPVQHRFLFYPPLFPYVIAAINNLMPEFNTNMYVSQTWIDLLSLLILLFSVGLYIKKKEIKVSVQLYLFLILWLGALFSFYGIQEGRPEVLCKFFMACFILNNIYQSKRFCNFNNGIIVGLNLITSPVSTFYLILLILGLLIYNKEFKPKPIVVTILGGAIILSGFTILYPYHLTELINGLQQHSNNVIANRYSTNSVKTFISFYITYAYAPLLLVNFIITILYTGYILLKKKNVLAFSLLLLLTGLVSYFSFKDMPMNYNMLVLSPFFFFVIFVIFTKVSRRNRPGIFLKATSATLVMLLFINATGFIRKTLLFYSTKQDQVSYLSFRKEFNSILRLTDKNKKVGITFSLWPYCLDQFKHITLNQTDTSIEYLMLQQSYSGLNQPQTRTKFKLIENHFVTKHPKLGKLPLGNTYPWYQTAVYERK